MAANQDQQHQPQQPQQPPKSWEQTQRELLDELTKRNKRP